MVPANMVSLTEDDIVKVITSFQGQKNQVLLWQRDEQGLKRHVQQARIALVNKEKGEIIINSDTYFTATKENPLYVFDNARQVVFKADIREMGPNQIILQFPQSLILPNTRLEERMNFLAQRIYVQFTHSLDLEELHKVQIIDVSPNGISFKATVEKSFGLQKGDRLWIKLYQDEELAEAVVKHMTTMKNGTQEQFIQVGVKFQS